VYNLNRYHFPGSRPAPPTGASAWGPATLIDIDFAVQQNAFVMDFAVDCVGNPWVTSCPYVVIVTLCWRQQFPLEA
jgi:hypothetical protein